MNICNNLFERKKLHLSDSDHISTTLLNFNVEDLCGQALCNHPQWQLMQTKVKIIVPQILNLFKLQKVYSLQKNNRRIKR